MYVFSYLRCLAFLMTWKNSLLKRSIFATYFSLVFFVILEFKISNGVICRDLSLMVFTLEVVGTESPKGTLCLVSLTAIQSVFTGRLLHVDAVLGHS